MFERALSGSNRYWAWIFFLLAVIGVGREVQGRVAGIEIGPDGLWEVAVDGERGLREARRDAFRNGARRRAGGHDAAGAIGERDSDVVHGRAVKRRGVQSSVGELVGTGGFEPPTSCVSSRRSNP